MEIVWLEDADQFKNIASEWDQFLIEEKIYNPFLLSDFILTWWKYYQKGLSFRFLIFYENNRIQGGIPLYTGRRRFRYGLLRMLTYIGDGVANYTEPCFSQSVPASALMEALQMRSDFDILCLKDVRHSNFLISPSTKPEKSFDHPLGRMIVRTIHDHYNWAIDLKEGRDVYLKTIPGKLRRDLRSRRRRATQELGSPRLIRVSGEEEVEKYFEIYVRLSHDSFQKRGNKSTFLDPRYVHFFRDFLKMMEKKQRLDAHILKGADEILAVSFAYRFGKGFHWALTAFNYKFRHLRPGYLLIEDLIREVVERGDTYYNWYGYERFYKEQWCNLKEPLYRFECYKNRFYSNAVRTLEVLRNFLYRH